MYNNKMNQMHKMTMPKKGATLKKQTPKKGKPAGKKKK